MIAFVYDTETTGLVENLSRKLGWQAECIEFYGCLVNLNDGEVLHDFETLIKPASSLKENIIKITSITDAMLASAPRFAAVYENIKQCIETAPCVIAHNANFDKEILDIECSRLNKQLQWPQIICTIEQTMHLKGYRLNLGELHKHLTDESFTDQHRAKPDAMALVRCCVELRRQGML